VLRVTGTGRAHQFDQLWLLRNMTVVAVPLTVMSAARGTTLVLYLPDPETWLLAWVSVFAGAVAHMDDVVAAGAQKLAETATVPARVAHAR